MKAVTACTMDCPDACSLIVEQREGAAVRLRGNPESPFTAGFVCAKIKDHIRRLGSAERIVHPLLRDGGGWRTIGWEEALDLCAGKIQALRSSPQAMLHIHSDGAKGVLKEAPALFFALLGASRTMGSLCDAAGYIGGIHDFGSRRNNAIGDLANAAAIVNWGRDLSRSSIHTAAMVKKARQKGTQVVTVSPGGDGNDPFSDARVRIRPGTDRFLAAAIIAMLRERGRIHPALLSRTRNPDQFLEMMAAHRIDELLAVCEISPADAEILYGLYADDAPAATLVGAGLQRYAFGGENVRFINALALLSGNIGISGGGSYFHTHSYGNLNLSWIRPDGHRQRRALPIAAIGREILAAREPTIRFIWVNGINVVNQAPDARKTASAFARVEFKVVVDGFMNDTARCADLILPATLMLEQEDIIGSYLHDFVQHVPAILAPPGQARSDWWIIREVAGRLQPPVDLPDEDACLRLALETQHLQTTLEALRRDGFVRALRPPVAYAGLVFDHPDGRYRFPDRLHAEPDPPVGYPLRLLTLIRRRAIHSQMLVCDQARPPAAWVAPDCPLLKTIDPAKAVKLVSPLGSLAVDLKLLPGLHPHAVLYRRGDWMSHGGGVNQLIEAGVTDIGKGAPYYQQYVRLENI